MNHHAMAGDGRRGSDRRRAVRQLPSSAVAEAAEEKHDQDNDENPGPDRHRLFLRPLASWVVYAPPYANTFLGADKKQTLSFRPSAEACREKLRELQAKHEPARRILNLDGALKQSLLLRHQTTHSLAPYREGTLADVVRGCAHRARRRAALPRFPLAAEGPRPPRQHRRGSTSWRRSPLFCW